MDVQLLAFIKKYIRENGGGGSSVPDSHKSAKTATATGTHGLRYYEGKLQYDDNGTWTTISIADLLI